jgi:hypothetical protein
LIPRNAPVSESVIRALPPALQYEVLHEIKYAERSKRREQLVRGAHSI